VWRKYVRENTTSNPLVSSAGAATSALTGQGGKTEEEWLEAQFARAFIPSVLTDQAERLDKAATGVELRKAEKFGDEFKKRIPILRGQLKPNQKKETYKSPIPGAQGLKNPSMGL
jgi:hypothetical protein